MIHDNEVTEKQENFNGNLLPVDLNLVKELGDKMQVTSGIKYLPNITYFKHAMQTPSNTLTQIS